MAMIARRLGRSVVLLERGRHPRMVIGESSTPLSNLLLEDLADRYDLPALRPLTKWGSWQRSYPGFACGLKRGFSFYHHDFQKAEQKAAALDQLLVAASPRDEIADTHWYRADVDAFLVAEAQRLGVDYLDGVSLESFVDAGEDVVLGGFRGREKVSYRARFLVDATGPRGFLHRAAGIAESVLPRYPATAALFSHFSNVARLKDASVNGLGEQPPYPVDDAAVHHVFEGGWIWVLRFNNGITSAGVAATRESAERFGLARGEEAWRQLIESIPVLGEQFRDASPTQPFQYTPRLSFRSSATAGKRWAMLPSTAGFVDPLLSTGFPLTLLGVSRLADIVAGNWGGEKFACELGLYARRTDEELLATARLISALYANMGNFPVFRSLSLLYFAAASFSETARRLGRPDLAASFLLHDSPLFGEACRDLLGRVSEGVPIANNAALEVEVRRIIEPIDVAGLGGSARRSWYPVIAEDLLRSASKLGATREEAARMLDRAGFYAVPA